MKQVNNSGYPTTVTDDAAVVPVPVSTVSAVLCPADYSRAQCQIFNATTGVLFVAWAETASTTAYTVQVPPKGLYELPRVLPYVGPVSGVLSAGTGTVMVTVAH